jgi:hypothetical protein
VRFRPVTQTRTGFGRGNCTEASIASLLGVEIDQVPDLWTGAPDGSTAEEHQPFANRLHLWQWLKSKHGVQLCGVKLATPERDLGEAWRRASDVIPLDVEAATWARHHLIIGHNPAGVWHQICGARHGRMVWDPNPSRAGVVDCQWVEWLVPLGCVPDNAIHLPSAEWAEPVPPSQEPT